MEHRRCGRNRSCLHQCRRRGHRPRQTGCIGKRVHRRGRCELVRHRHLHQRRIPYRTDKRIRLAEPRVRRDDGRQGHNHGRMRIQRGFQTQGGHRPLLRRGFAARHALHQAEGAHRRAHRIRKFVDHRPRGRRREQVGHRDQRSLLRHYGGDRILRSREYGLDPGDRDRRRRERGARAGHHARRQPRRRGSALGRRVALIHRRMGRDRLRRVQSAATHGQRDARPQHHFRGVPPKLRPQQEDRRLRHHRRHRREQPRQPQCGREHPTYHLDNRLHRFGTDPLPRIEGRPLRHRDSHQRGRGQHLRPVRPRAAPHSRRHRQPGRESRPLRIGGRHQVDGHFAHRRFGLRRSRQGETHERADRRRHLHLRDTQRGRVPRTQRFDHAGQRRVRNRHERTPYQQIPAARARHQRRRHVHDDQYQLRIPQRRHTAALRFGRHFGRNRPRTFLAFRMAQRSRPCRNDG